MAALRADESPASPFSIGAQTRFARTTLSERGAFARYVYAFAGR